MNLQRQNIIFLIGKPEDAPTYAFSKIIRFVYPITTLLYSLPINNTLYMTGNHNHFANR